MDETVTENNTDHLNSMEPHWPILSKSRMPAYVPAVSVAIAMLIFLAASFYVRHRKVVKKRQILMDYFYIILQYGGLRRKRMVTSLCNTNAITLRQLGRSFMLSFDSRDNSCPFYLDDTAFTKPASQYMSSNSNKSEREKRGNLLRAPFKRVMSQIDDSNIGNSVHEMLMKFKSKRKGANSTTASKHNLAAPVRRSSLSSIHEDESSIGRYDLETTPLHFSHRKDTYEIMGHKNQSASYADAFGEFDDQPFQNLLIEEINASRRSSSFRRKSYPNNSSDVEDEEYRILDPNLQNLRVVHLGTNTSRRNSAIVNPERMHSKQYSNNEPLILVHSASNDITSSQESDEIQAQCSNGIVFLRRISRDCSRGEFGQPLESTAPSYSQHKRASLSTVSYVPSGNMNEYYHHCLPSSKESPDSNEDNDKFETEADGQTGKSRSRWSRKKTPFKAYSPKTTSCRGSRSKRLSLGEIGISNFNQRIEGSLGSMHEQESEGGSFSRTSKDLPDDKGKQHTAWRRLKNVFAGIRWSQSSGSKMKQMKSSQSEERNKMKCKRVHNATKWNRFLSVLTGFRSLPEDKKFSSNPEVHLGSKSLPMGLDKHCVTIDDLDFHFARSLDSQTAKQKKRIIKTSFSKADVIEQKTPRRAPPKTRSFPDNIFFFQGDTRKVPCLYHLQSDPSGTATYQKCSTRKCRRRNDINWEDNQRYRSNIDFLHSPLHLGNLPFSLGPNNHCFYHRSGSASPRATSPVCTKPDRRYRSLSPLPERQHFSSGPRKEKNVRWYSHSERSSFSERGLVMSSFDTTRRNNSFSFPSESMSKGNWQSNITSGTNCVQKSDDNLGRSSLLSVNQTNQTSRERNSTDSLDYITIDMEHCDTENVISTGMDEGDIHENGEKIKTENSSLESEITTKDIEQNISCSNSHSKSSLQTHDKTNSSLDSVYFDAFSIPGSPLINVVPTTSDSKHSSICHASHISQCGDYSSSTQLPTSRLPPLENSSSLTFQSVSHSTGTNVSVTSNEDSENVTNSASSPYIHAFQTFSNPTTRQCVTPISCSSDPSEVCTVPDQAIHSPAEPSAVDIACCSISLTNEIDDTKKDDDHCIAPDTKRTIHSPCDDNAVIMEPCTDSTLLLPSQEKTHLQHQDSLTSDEESYMANLARLPRFGRRASQCASPTRVDSPTCLAEKKKTEESPGRKSLTPQIKSDASSTGKFVYEIP